jgi:hypothetical protein
VGLQVKVNFDFELAPSLGYNAAFEDCEIRVLVLKARIELEPDLHIFFSVAVERALVVRRGCAWESLALFQGGNGFC